MGYYRTDIYHSIFLLVIALIDLSKILKQTDLNGYGHWSLFSLVFLGPLHTLSREKTRMTTILEADHLTKIYGSERAVNEVTFRWEKAHLRH